MATLIRYEDALTAIWNGNAIPLVDREKQKALLEQLVSKYPGDAKPVVDAVEVVRCKDCKHRKEYNCDRLSVDGTKVGVNEDWFCADGERQ